MKSIAIAVMALCLAGCGLCPTKEPIVTTVTVEVPVAVKCEVSYPKKPDSLVVGAGKEAKSFDTLKASLKELEDYRWYSREMEGALLKCAKNIDEGTEVK